jgi:CRISPR-associated protein Cas6
MLDSTGVGGQSVVLSRIVDLAFPIHGDQIPADHGYVLYAGLCQVQQSLHGAPWLGVHPIKGIAGGASLRLPPGSKLRLRLPVDRVGEALPLVGQTITVGDPRIRLKAPQLTPLRPAVTLYSRLVIIKGFMDRDAFGAAVQRQLDTLRAQCKVTLGPRRTCRIKDRVIVGHAVWLSELSAEESIDVQERGLGGRRHMGCGLFSPVRGPWQ